MYITIVLFFIAWFIVRALFRRISESKARRRFNLWAENYNKDCKPEEFRHPFFYESWVDKLFNML